MTPWQVLGIERTSDIGVIRRAYADILKRNRPDDDPEAFTRLRAAYESALAHARVAAAHPPPERGEVQARTPSVVTELESGPRSVPADIRGVTDGGARPVPADIRGVTDGGARPVPADVRSVTAEGASAASESLVPVHDLQAAFSALHAAALADGTNPQALLPMLEECLRSPALQNVSIQLQFEAHMVAFLLRTQPRSDLLLEPVIDRWKLRERRRVAGAQAGYLVGYADNAKHLRYLQEFEPRTYRALTGPPRHSLLRWLEIIFLGIDQPVRAALSHFGSIVPRSINPAALAWWSRFFTTPHIRPNLVRLTAALGVLGIIAGAFANEHAPLAAGAALGGGAGLVAGTLLTGLWLLAIDLPRHRLKAARRGASLGLRAGWLPAGIALCLVATFCPDSRVGALLVGAGAVSILVWSVLMAPELRDISGASVRTRLIALVVINAPLVIWWFLMADDSDARLTLPLWIAGTAVLIAATLGQPILGRDFLHMLGQKSRQWTRGTIAAAAAAVIAAVYFDGIARAWLRPLLIIQLAIVLAQRIAVVNLTEMQRKIRWYVPFYGSLLLARAFGDLEQALMPTGMNTLRLGSFVFMGGVILMMLVCLYNERKGLEEEPAAA